MVEHPEGGNSQKKVQQTHKGLQLFGHSFVVGLASDGVTEVVAGTYGTVVTGLDEAVPDVNPKLTEAEVSLLISCSLTSSASLIMDTLRWGGMLCKSDKPSIIIIIIKVGSGGSHKKASRVCVRVPLNHAGAPRCRAVLEGCWW